MPNIYIILALSLFIIPLIGSVIIEPILSITDASKVKEFLILLSMISIIIIKFMDNKNENINRHNYWLYGMIMFIIYSAFHAPQINIFYGVGNLGNSWIWVSTLWAIVYFMFYLALVKSDPPEYYKKFIVLAIGGAAILSAGYAYLQAFGIDQIQYIKFHRYIGEPRAKNITAMIGNPTYLGVWLSMSLPFVWLHLKKRWSIFVIGAILLTQSTIAIGGLFFYGFIEFHKRARAKIKGLFWVVLMVAISLTVYLINSNRIETNGRLTVWKQAYNDINKPINLYPIDSDTMTIEQMSKANALNQMNYSWTGQGLGSFPHIFSIKHNSRWESAHNEFLEIPLSLGIFGMLIFLGMISYVLYHGYYPKHKFYQANYTSLIYSIIASTGIPILHIEPLRYLVALTFIMVSILVAKK